MQESGCVQVNHSGVVVADCNWGEDNNKIILVKETIIEVRGAFGLKENTKEPDPVVFSTFDAFGVKEKWTVKLGKVFGFRGIPTYFTGKETSSRSSCFSRLAKATHWSDSVQSWNSLVIQYNIPSYAQGKGLQPNKKFQSYSSLVRWCPAYFDYRRTLHSQLFLSFKILGFIGACFPYSFTFFCSYVFWSCKPNIA